MSDLGKLGVLEEFMRQRLWFIDVGQERRVVGMSIKIEPTGYLAVVKTISAEGPEVCFVGTKTLDGIRRNLLDRSERDTRKWREDKYRVDKNSPSQ